MEMVMVTLRKDQVDVIRKERERVGMNFSKLVRDMFDDYYRESKWRW